MSRLLVLLPILLWVIWLGQTPAPAHTLAPAPTPLLGPLAFLLGLVATVIIARLEAQHLARRPADAANIRRLNRFARLAELARIGLVVWFAVGLWLLEFGQLVLVWTGGLLEAGVQTPSVLLAVLPVYAAGTAFWWATWPVDVYRQQVRALHRFDEGLPVQGTPSARRYVLANLRMGLLFGLAPILAVLLLRDTLALLWIGLFDTFTAGAQLLITLSSVAGVMLAAPIFLVRMLATSPMPDSPLRQDLVALARRTNVRYREILVWHTDHTICNAAVMGLLPQARYVLVSDLLLVSLTDKQVEAVFAHEAGHVRHRHMLWYALFIAAIVFAAAGPGESLLRTLEGWLNPGDAAGALLGPTPLAAMFVVCVLVGFGLLSRMFERQADLFAARAVGTEASADVRGNLVQTPEAPLTAAGAGAFASALQRVAAINNMTPQAALAQQPIRRVVHRLVQELRHFFHGSPELRTSTLHRMSRQPAAVARFDLLTRGVMITILLTCLFSAAWTLAISL